MDPLNLLQAYATYLRELARETKRHADTLESVQQRHANHVSAYICQSVEAQAFGDPDPHLCHNPPGSCPKLLDN